MKKVIYILVWTLCFGLSSCRSQKEAVPATAATANPYLMHYLPAAPDSLQLSPVPGTKQKKEELNLDQLREKVNPNKDDGLWGSTIREILESIFSKKH